MDSKRIVKILGDKGVKATANRMLVMDVLLRAQRPLSATEIGKELLSLDKSSIFRVLTLFQQQEVVHTIEDGSGALKYERCTEDHNHYHDDEHPHFYCERCHRMFCLDNQSIPSIDIPEGYHPHFATYIVHGICPECCAK